MKWKKLDLRRFEGGCFVNSARPIPHLGRRTLVRKMATMVMVMGVVVDWLVVVLEQQMMVIVMVMVMRVPGGSLFQIRMLWRRTRGKLTA